MIPVALTSLQKVGILAGIVVGVGGLIVATVNAWLSIMNERKRTQPIVLAHQAGGRHFAHDIGRFGGPTGAGHFVVDTRLTNDGEGTAFQREIWRRVPRRANPLQA